MLQGTFDEVFGKMAESPTWEALCSQVFGQYVGQFSYTPVTQIHLLAKKLHITSQSHVLELGPGTGGLSLYLASLTGCRLTGLDASPLAVKIANKRAMLQGLADVHFEVGILPELPYRDCSFDVVVSIGSVGHVADKTALFSSCYRVLRPGSYLGFCALYRRRKLYPENPMHMIIPASHPYSRLPSQPYSKLLEETGFNDISKTDLTEDFIRLAKHWVKAMQENVASLEKELGRKITNSLSEEFVTTCVLATEGYLGRALFKAQRTEQVNDT